jgi:hypothetical protein
MSPRIGALIALCFSLVWLYLGVTALTGATKIVAGAIGIAVVLYAARRAWVRPPGGLRFERKWMYIAIFGELAAMFVASYVMGQYGLFAYVWPVVGIIVGLHFYAFWRATRDRRFLWLTGGMTAINLVALMLPIGPPMQLVNGFGSFASLVLAVGV